MRVMIGLMIGLMIVASTEYHFVMSKLLNFSILTSERHCFILYYISIHISMTGTWEQHFAIASVLLDLNVCLWIPQINRLNVCFNKNYYLLISRVVNLYVWERDKKRLGRKTCCILFCCMIFLLANVTLSV